MKTAAAKIILGWTNGGMKFVLTLALTLNPLPQERKSPLADSGLADDRPANSVAQIFKRTANGSPSPWGEGGVEGERYTKLHPRGNPRGNRFGMDDRGKGAFEFWHDKKANRQAFFSKAFAVSVKPLNARMQISSQRND